MVTEFERLVLGALNVLLGAAAAPAPTDKKEASTYYEDWLYRSRKLLEDGEGKTAQVVKEAVKEALSK